MDVGETFDEWAASGRDRGMEDRHWHTARHALAAVPVEPGDAVLDLGTGSGYALRALRERDAARGVGIDRSGDMLSNARSYTDDDAIEYVRADFEELPFPDGAFEHCFSMEAFYYAPDPDRALEEVRRVLVPGGTFSCAVNFYEENPYSHDWPEKTGLDMTRWSRGEYRRAFRRAGFHVGVQTQVPDRETEIPSPESFPTDGFETREAMVERYRELGTLLTVGVVP